MMCPMRCSLWSRSLSCCVACSSAHVEVAPVSSTMDTVSAAKPLRRCDASVVRNVMRSLLVSYGEPTGLAIIDCQPLNVVEEYEADVRLGCAVRERRERPVYGRNEMDPPLCGATVMS